MSVPIFSRPMAINGWNIKLIESESHRHERMAAIAEMACVVQSEIHDRSAVICSETNQNRLNMTSV